MVGVPRGCSISRAAATPNASSCPRKPSRKSTRRPIASARCSRTWCSIRRRGSRTSTTTPRLRTRARPIRSISCRAPRAPGAPDTRRTSSSSPRPPRTGRAGPPKNFLSPPADVFGVIPPIAKLPPAQAMYHFLSGYTAKVAGTEKGLVGVQPDFSTCFGAPFLPRPPAEYGNLLREYISKHKVDCWLVNSGWTGGIYGVGRRMPIKATRALVSGALAGSLRGVGFRTDPYFGFAVPTSVPGIEPHLLYPMKTWKDKAAFDQTARKLVRMFQENFVKYEKHVDADVRSAAPEVRIAAE